MSAIFPDSAVQMPSLTVEPNCGHPGHVVQLYSNDAFLFDVLSRYVGDAIAAGDGAVVIATKAHQDGLEERLRERGLLTTGSEPGNRYLCLEAGETLSRFMANGSVDESSFMELMNDVITVIKSGAGGKDPRITVFGELVALLWAQGKASEAIKVERLWNQLAQKHSFNLLCAYPISAFGNEKDITPFIEMCSQHSDVIPSESYLQLDNEAERLRSIAQLQQKAQVLEKELTARAGQEQFQQFVDAVRDYAIFMLDTDGSVRTWNAGAERIKGYKAAEIIGKHFSCFYPEEDRQHGKPQWELVLAAKDGRFEDEGWRIRQDGSRFWANVVITAVRDRTGKLVGFGKVTRDFTDRMQMEKQVRDSEKLLRELSHHLLQSQDEERRRIGRDLHDSLGQYLAALKMKLEVLRCHSEDHSELRDCVRLVEDSIKEVRTISYLLYPPMLEETGLESAIHWYLDGFSGRSGVKINFDVDREFQRLARDVELALFRVLQESLTNVHRHSGSQTASIRLFRRDGMAVLEIQDQGRGFPRELLQESGVNWAGAFGVGLRGMRERMHQLGGQLEVLSSASGTTVSALVPAKER